MYQQQQAYPQQQQAYPQQQQAYPQQQQAYPHQQQAYPQQQQAYPQQHQAYPQQQQAAYPQQQQMVLQPARAMERIMPQIKRIERKELPKVTPITSEDRQKKALELGLTEEQILDAKQEHNEGQLEMGESVTFYKDKLGSGIVYYFEFVKFLGFVNVIFLILQTIHYAYFASEENPTFESEQNTYGDRKWYHHFMITTYTEGQKDAWIVLNVFAIVFTFGAAPLYYKFMQKRELEEDANIELHNEEATRDQLIRFTDEGRIDVSDYYRTTTDLFLRRLAAWIILLVLIGIQIFASYFITKGQDDASITVSFGIAFIVVALNSLFRLVSKYLTELEKWSTYAMWKRFHTIKLLAFKMGNIITVYSAKDYSATKEKNCTYDVIGEQFITLMLVEIVAMNFLEIVTAMLWNTYHDTIAQKIGSILGDEDNMPPFDLAMQYLYSVYRQYLTIMAMAVCPLLSGLGAIGFFFQFWVDKFKLYKLCGRPRRMLDSQKTFLAVVLCIIAIAAMFTPFAGSVWIMSGVTRDTSPRCHFP